MKLSKVQFVSTPDTTAFFDDDSTMGSISAHTNSPRTMLPIREQQPNQANYPSHPLPPPIDDAIYHALSKLLTEKLGIFLGRMDARLDAFLRRLDHRRLITPVPNTTPNGPIPVTPVLPTFKNNNRAPTKKSEQVGIASSSGASAVPVQKKQTKTIESRQTPPQQTESETTDAVGNEEQQYQLEQEEQNDTNQVRKEQTKRTSYTEEEQDEEIGEQVQFQQNGGQDSDGQGDLDGKDLNSEKVFFQPTELRFTHVDYDDNTDSSRQDSNRYVEFSPRWYEQMRSRYVKPMFQVPAHCHQTLPMPFQPDDRRHCRIFRDSSSSASSPNTSDVHEAERLYCSSAYLSKSVNGLNQCVSRLSSIADGQTGALKLELKQVITTLSDLQLAVRGVYEINALHYEIMCARHGAEGFPDVALLELALEVPASCSIIGRHAFYRERQQAIKIAARNAGVERVRKSTSKEPPCDNSDDDGVTNE